jgi:hypothetical protein
MGTGTELHVFLSKVPSEVFGDSPPLTSDLRRISYWLDGESGLCRMESSLITSDEATTIELPTGDVGKYLLAHEVKNLEFRYFDGTNWTDTWDSTALGQDNVTPMGSPRAIEVKMSLQLPKGKFGSKEQVKNFRQVILITTAGGTPLPATTTTTGGGTTSP